MINKCQKPKSAVCNVRFCQIKHGCEFYTGGPFCDPMNCPCGRLLYRAWLWKQLELHFDPNRTYFVTIYLNRDVRSEGKLGTLNVANSNRALVRHFKKADIKGLRLTAFPDIQLREYAGKSVGRPADWLCHWHCLLMSSESARAMKEKLEAQIPKSKRGT